MLMLTKVLLLVGGMLGMYFVGYYDGKDKEVFKIFTALGKKIYKKLSEWSDRHDKDEDNEFV